jgi:hypothetical protein
VQRQVSLSVTIEGVLVLAVVAYLFWVHRRKRGCEQTFDSPPPLPSGPISPTIVSDRSTAGYSPSELSTVNYVLYEVNGTSKPVEKEGAVVNRH